MKREMPKAFRAYFILLGVLAVLCILAGIFWFAADKRRTHAEPRYLLKDSAGYLALYAADGSGPLARYDIYTRLLPEADVLALQQGITVQDEAELQQKLEDYGL